MSIDGSSVNPATAHVLRERYELGERLAEGTFFHTYRGRDLETGRPVAIKVLKPEYGTDEAFSGRLLTEASSSIRLQHPNIAQVYDAWREHGTVIIIADFIRGINLKDRIRRVAPFPLAVAVDIFQACAEALNYAHENGYVHGDVRPDNVIITPDGRVKLTDFGVGASAAASTRIQLGSLERAAYYLAPEMVEGRPPDARTDLYSLGCLLYEMLAGVVPFDADTPLAVAVKHIRNPTPSVKQVNPSVPLAVDGIAQKCMQKEPMARYITAQGLLQDVRQVQDALRSDGPLNWTPLKAAPEPPPAEGPRARRAEAPPRRPVPVEPPEDGGPSWKLFAGVALAGLLMVALFFGVAAMFTDAPPEALVPPLVGKTQTEAAAELQKYGLAPQVQQDFNDKFPAGTVFRTVPAGGTTMRSGKNVVLYVSKGPQPVTVPDVVGKSLGSAQADLKSVGLALGETSEEFSEVISKGDVISQNPAGGTTTKKQTTVNLVVSKGPEPIPEPENVEVIPGEEETRPEEPTPPEGETPAAELPFREHEVNIKVPERAEGAQQVRIVVRNEDGTENTAYEQEHLPGEEVKQLVTTQGAKGKSQIRVYLNGRLVHRSNR